MNNQLKLLLYVVFLVVTFIFIQDSFKLPEIPFLNTFKFFKEDTLGEETAVIVEEKKSILKKDEKNYVEISLKNGSKLKVDVEVADTELERALGLSNRRYLGDYNGMLFIFDQKVNSTFWMKDTLIPLDIIFIDELGFIVDIGKENQPCSDTSCPQISSNSMYRYVLEVNGGFCDLNEVSVGQSLVMYLAQTD